MSTSNTYTANWPELAFEDLKGTLETVQLWTQIIGKIRLIQTPWINHSWHVTLYVSSRGLTTGSIPYEGGNFQLDMDFIHHELIITSSDGQLMSVALHERTVASFYKEL